MFKKTLLAICRQILYLCFFYIVDHETYLHQEEDPRYRGAAIPSRAFRFLQNMTDSSDATVTCAGKPALYNKYFRLRTLYYYYYYYFVLIINFIKQ